MKHRIAIDILEGVAAGPWQLANLVPRAVKRDFRPGFNVNPMRKDLRLVMGLPVFDNPPASDKTDPPDGLFSSDPPKRIAIL